MRLRLSLLPAKQLMATVDMNTMPLGWRHIRIVAVASLGQLTGAGLSTLVGIIIPMIQLISHPELSPVEQGFMASISLVGITAGSLIFGNLSDRYGYLLFFRLCPAIVFAAATAACIFPSTAVLPVCLFIIGLGIGGEYSLDSDYISELMPTRWKLLMVGIAKASSSLGNIVVALICLIVMRNTESAGIWNRLMLIIAALGAIMVICRTGFRESPGWLITKGRPQQADTAAKAFLGKEVTLGNNTSATKSNTQHARLLTLKNLPKIIFSGVPWACEGLGVYGIGVFTPILVMRLGILAETPGTYAHIVSSVEMTAYINMIILPGFITGLLLLNRMYHPRTQTWGFMLSAAGLGILLWGYLSHAPAWISVAGFMMFMFFLNAGPHLITFVIPAQIYPVAVRGEGAGLAAAFGKIGAVAGVFVIPILLSAGGLTLVMIVSIATMLTGGIITAVLAGKVLPRNQT